VIKQFKEACEYADTHPDEPVWQTRKVSVPSKLWNQFQGVCDKIGTDPNHEIEDFVRTRMGVVPAPI